MASKSKQNGTILEGIYRGIRAITKRRTTPWQGTITELGDVLSGKGFPIPGSASALRIALNKQVNKLRNAGISIRFARSTDYMRTRLITIIAR